MSKVISELLVSFGLDVDQNSFQQAQNGITGMGGALKTLAGIAAGGIGLKEIVDQMGQTADYWDTAGKSARFYREELQKVQGLQQAVIASGGTAEGANKIIESFRKGKDFLLANPSAEMNKDASEAAKHGFDFSRQDVDTAGQWMDKIYENSHDIVINGSEEEKAKLTQALQAMGMNNSATWDMLRNDRSPTEEAAYRNLYMPGKELQEEYAKNGEEFNSATQNLKNAINAQTDAFTNKLLPAVTDTAQFMADWISGNQHSVEESENYQPHGVLPSSGGKDVYHYRDRYKRKQEEKRINELEELKRRTPDHLRAPGIDFTGRSNWSPQPSEPLKIEVSLSQDLEGKVVAKATNNAVVEITGQMSRGESYA